MKAHKNKHSSATEALFSFSCRHRQRLESQHLLSDELDFVDSESLLSSKKQLQVRANKMTSARRVLQRVCEMRYMINKTFVFPHPATPCHLLSAPQVQCARFTGQRAPRSIRTCSHPGGQSLHQQRGGADDQPASAPRGHRPRLLAGRQLLHRQQPHGSGEAQPIRFGRNAEPEAIG